MVWRGSPYDFESVYNGDTQVSLGRTPDRKTANFPSEKKIAIACLYSSCRRLNFDWFGPRRNHDKRGRYGLGSLRDYTILVTQFYIYDRWTTCDPWKLLLYVQYMLHKNKKGSWKCKWPVCLNVNRMKHDPEAQRIVVQYGNFCQIGKSVKWAYTKPVQLPFFCYLIYCVLGFVLYVKLATALLRLPIGKRKEGEKKIIICRLEKA